MLTLIKREIEDHIVYFLGMVILAVIAIFISIMTISHSPPVAEVPLVAFSVITILSMFSFCGMGVSQMYTDKTRKISSFLSTLPVTRNRILIARVTAGILAILTLLIPLVVAAKILIHFLAPPVPIYDGMVLEIFVSIFLMCFACYCIGLLTGWNRNVLTPTLGGLALTCILVPLIIIKGFGLHIAVILLVFVVSSLICTWHKFLTNSL